MELKTPRGTFNGVEFATEQEARNAGYGYYFTDDTTEIYVYIKHSYENFNICKFGFVRRAN